MIKAEEKKIYLSWQQYEHQGRYIVAELIESSVGQYCFRYLSGKDLEDAQKLGFQGYPAFPDFRKEYNQNVIESFSMRLPARSRGDFKDLLTYWEINDTGISDFDLISITGGRLLTDTFEFIDPHANKRPDKFLTELAGFVHYAEDNHLRNIPVDSILQLERQTDNQWDPYAVKVLYKGKHVGYIKKLHAETIAEALNGGQIVVAKVSNANINGIINSILLRITIEESTD